MPEGQTMTIAAKCTPDEEFLVNIEKAGISAVELYTHIHHSPEHSGYFLNLIKEAGYTGLVVSEAKTSLQTYDEFKKLNDFYKLWESKSDIG